ncbi:hypothetical protein AAII07_54425 [Microvirga sp. 0TCS3.31]
MVRSLAKLRLVIAMLLPMDGHASQDQLPDPPPSSTSQKVPAFPSLDRTAVTLSGLSSGGFFVHQSHVAFSSLVKGAGIIAGGRFGCVETIPDPWSPFWPAFPDRVSAAVVACTHYGLVTL